MVDEESIDNMSFIFFESVMSELGHKLTYDAIVNYAGNSFCEKSWDMIVEHNPLNFDENATKKKSEQALSKIFNSSNIKVMKK